MLVNDDPSICTTRRMLSELTLELVAPGELARALVVYMSSTFSPAKGF
jgi:hypothetical protein